MTGSDGDRNWVIGDIHGCYAEAVTLLEGCGLTDSYGRWTGGDATLWFVGDLTDRGPQGLETIDLVMRLQAEAIIDGGHVGCLVGNHEIFLLAARRFGNTEMMPGEITFHDLWAMNGGKEKDLEGLTDERLNWLASLPAAALVGRYLIVHADSDYYLELGTTIDRVNSNMRRLLALTDPDAWVKLITTSVRRNELYDDTPEGAAALEKMLLTFGAEVLVHGHTPIPLVTGLQPGSVSEPYVYSGGRCVNVDGGMFLGSPGVAYRLGQGEQ